MNRFTLIKPMDSGSWSSKSGDGDFRTSSITEMNIESHLKYRDHTLDFDPNSNVWPP